MSINATQFDRQAIEARVGISIKWQCTLEVELEAKKRKWLKSFSRPTILSDDITKTDQPTIHDDMSGGDVPLPDWLACYVFGFSCKDLSTLNNESGPWRSECLSGGLGSTGKPGGGISTSFGRRALSLPSWRMCAEH